MTKGERRWRIERESISISTEMRVSTLRGWIVWVFCFTTSCFTCLSLLMLFFCPEKLPHFLFSSLFYFWILEYSLLVLSSHPRSLSISSPFVSVCTFSWWISFLHPGHLNMRESLPPLSNQLERGDRGYQNNIINGCRDKFIHWPPNMSTKSTLSFSLSS